MLDLQLIIQSQYWLKKHNFCVKKSRYWAPSKTQIFKDHPAKGALLREILSFL